MGEEEHNENFNLPDEFRNGSWLEERKFVLSQLAKHERGIYRLNKLIDTINLAMLNEMHKLDIKIVRVTVWQTVFLTVAITVIKWLLKV
jgi:hypothetical protein